MENANADAIKKMLTEVLTMSELCCFIYVKNNTLTSLRPAASRPAGESLATPRTSPTHTGRTPGGMKEILQEVRSEFLND